MKIVNSAQEAISNISSNSAIFVHGAAATPGLLVDALGQRASELTNIEMIHLHTEGEAFYANPQWQSRFKTTSLFTGKNLRGKINFDSVDYLPCFLSEIPSLFRKGYKKVDVALIQVSPPDSHGYVSLGVSVDVAKAAVDCAKTVIAMINPQMPRVHGDGIISVDKITTAFQCNTPIYSPKAACISDVEKLVGKNVAELVEDGATLQLGIGNIPDAVCSNLKNHKHLGLHTEMWSDGALSLVKCGAIDNSKKTFHAGKNISAFLIGSKELYDFVNDNVAVMNLEASYVNYPINIIRNPKITAINSAVEIDLTGQICADSIGSKIISGVGGQMDFMRAAALSAGGKPIIAITSTTNKGSSRIVSRLKPGAGVVTTRSHVHYVVTEYGAVNLFGKSLGERANALISIAAPEHREQLQKDWQELKKSL